MVGVQTLLLFGPLVALAGTVLLLLQPIGREIKFCVGWLGWWVAVWSFAQVELVRLPMHELFSAEFWARIACLGMLPVPVVAWQANLGIRGMKRPLLVAAAYGCLAVFGLAAIGSGMIRGVWFSVDSGLWVGTAGPWFLGWLLFAGLIGFRVLAVLTAVPPAGGPGETSRRTCALAMGLLFFGLLLSSSVLLGLPLVWKAGGYAGVAGGLCGVAGFVLLVRCVRTWCRAPS